MTIGGAPASQVTVASQNQITAILPAKPGAFGRVSVIVQSLDGQMVSRSDLFSYYASQLSFSLGTFAVGSVPSSVAIGDLSGDQEPALAVVNQGSNDNNVSVLLGDGMGGFGKATNYAVGMHPRSAVISDFNGDKKLDVAVANVNSNIISLLGCDGLGGFGAARNTDYGGSPDALVVGDFNADQKPDIVAANINSANISVLLGDGQGGFGSATNFGALADPQALVVGDSTLVALQHLLPRAPGMPRPLLSLVSAVSKQNAR